MVTLQTQGLSLLQRVGGPFYPINLGRGKKWMGYKTKFQLLLPFLERHDDDQVVAFMDGSDIFWGGCAMDQFKKAYEEIVHLSGATIVISAEIACGEQPCDIIPKVPGWAEEWAGRKLNDGWWSQYLGPGGCQSECECANPPAVKFLNSGFLMGPVRDLKHMISWSLKNYDWASTLGDQSVLAKYWLHHRSKIALDYTGALCLSG